MQYKTAWSYEEIDHGTVVGVLENITQRTFFWNNLNGSKVRLKFSNKFGYSSMKIEKVLIGLNTYVTYKGEKSIIIPPKGEFYSDEIDFELNAGEDIVISMYFKERNEIASVCTGASGISWHSEYKKDGDFSKDEVFEGDKSEDIYSFLVETGKKKMLSRG